MAQPDDTVGELWAIYFDGESGDTAAAKSQVPIAQCSFSTTELDVVVGRSTLVSDGLRGAAESGGNAVSWDLRYAGEQQPLLLLPAALYERSIPKAKALVGTPQAVFDGALVVNGKHVAVDGWVGSQNHNWGSQHTDLYAWGQVAGFDDAPDVFLECSTARLRFGPVWTPRFSLVVLRLGDRELALNSLWQALRARGDFSYFRWDIATCARDIKVAIKITAPATAFVGLTYDNPPGGSKTCLNTKLAACSVSIEEPGKAPVTMTTTHRAAFEILTDDNLHGVPIVA